MGLGTQVFVTRGVIVFAWLRGHRDHTTATDSAFSECVETPRPLGLIKIQVQTSHGVSLTWAKSRGCRVG